MPHSWCGNRESSGSSFRLQQRNVKKVTIGTTRVLVLPGYWYYRGTGTTGVLVLSGYWYYQGTGTTRVLVLPGYWYYRGTGTTGVLVLSGYWYYQGTGTTRVLVDCSSLGFLAEVSIELRNTGCADEKT